MTTPKQERGKRIKCYEVTPSGDSRFDTIVVEAGESWNEALYQVENSLEDQLLNDKSWEEISVTVKCVYKTRQQIDELEIE